MNNYKHSKSLGILWNVNVDSFFFTFNDTKHNTNCVLIKRLILSAIAKLFDALGLVGLTIKYITQQLWKAKLE